MRDGAGGKHGLDGTEGDRGLEREEHRQPLQLLWRAWPAQPRAEVSMWIIQPGGAARRGALARRISRISASASF